MDAPTLAAITFHTSGGGVAAVARLLWKVIDDRWSGARTLVMFDHPTRPATLTEKARFSSALVREQARGATDWILFSHLGLAQVQNAVPRRWRRPYGVFLHGIEAWGKLTLAQK